MSWYATKVNDPCHYATDEELAWMNRVGRTFPPNDLVVMLGAGPGVFLLALKDTNPDIQAVVIDHTSCQYIDAYLHDAGYPQNVRLIVDDSVEVGHRWDGRKIQLLIVDTDHTERTTDQEIREWLPHVADDGLIFFHDYDATGTWFEDQEQYPGVKAAVDRLMAKWTFVERVGTAVIYQKTPKPKLAPAPVPVLPASIPESLPVVVDVDIDVKPKTVQAPVQKSRSKAAPLKRRTRK